MHPNTILRYCIYVGLFVVPFIFFVVPGSLLFPFISGKAFYFRLITEIIFGLWLILALRASEYKLRSSLILKAVSIFILVVLLADILALNPFKAFWSNYERMEGFVALAHFFAYFLVLGTVFQTKEVWNKFLATNVAASAIMAIYSFFQISGKLVINQGGVRVDGTFGNASYLGIYMVFNIFLAAILFVQSKNRVAKIALSLVALADLIILYHTATRGAILGLIGGAFIAFVYLAFKADKGERIRKIAVGFVAGLIVLAGLFYVVRNSSFVKESPVLSRFSSLSFSEIKTQGRYYVWPMALKGVKDRPILGWGQEGFNYVFNKYYDPHMYNQEPWFDRTHDIILDWLVSAGVLGLASYLFIFVALLLSLRRLEGVISKEEKALLYGLSFAYIFHNLFVFDQIGSYILFFSILAYLHTLSSKDMQGRAGNLQNRLLTSFGSSSSRPVTDSIIVIILLVTSYFVVYIPWIQNKNIIQTLRAGNEATTPPLSLISKPLESYNMGFPEALEHVSQSAVNIGQRENVPLELKQQIFSVVDAAFKKHLERSPYDARHRILYSLFLSRFSRYEDAIVQLEEASKISPNKQSIYIELGSQLILSGKPNDALPMFKKAYELEPSYAEAKFTYAIGAIYAKDFALADELLKDVPSDVLSRDDRLLGALFAAGKYNQVIDLVKMRIENEPTNTQHRITLASIFLQLGRRAEAIAELEQVIKIDPSFKEQGEYYIKEIRAGRNP